MKGLTSRDIKYRNYNCSKPNKLEDDRCMYNGKCRETYVVYKVQCKLCQKIYAGNI